MKIPNQLLIIMFFVVFSSVIYSFVLCVIEDTMDVKNIFNLLNKFFLSLILSGLYLAIIKQRTNKIKLLNSKILTLSMLVLGTIAFSIFIVKLIDIGIVTNDKKILFWQVSISILATFSIGLLIKLHVKLKKKTQIT